MPWFLVSPSPAALSPASSSHDPLRQRDRFPFPSGQLLLSQVPEATCPPLQRSGAGPLESVALGWNPRCGPWSSVELGPTLGFKGLTQHLAQGEYFLGCCRRHPQGNIPHPSPEQGPGGGHTHPPWLPPLTLKGAARLATIFCLGPE